MIRARASAFSMTCLFLWNVAFGQAPQVIQPSSGQKTICTKYHVAGECVALATEFDPSNRSLSSTQTTFLDSQFGDVTPFITENVKVAYTKYLAGQAATLAKREVLQAISTETAITQVGSAPSSSGSTNLVSKPTTTDFLSVAAESGAFTDTLNGTSVSIQANADGLLKYLANKPVFERWENKYASVLQPLGFTVSENVAQSGATTAPVTGQGTTSTPSLSQVILPSNNASFSSFTATYAIYRKYTPQNKAFQDAWSAALKANKAKLDAAGQQIALAAGAWLVPALSDLPKSVTDAQSTWHVGGKKGEDTNDFDSFVSAYADYYKVMSDYLISTTADAQNLLALNMAVSAYNNAAWNVFNQARGTPLASISYVYSTPVQQPATHQGTIAIGDLFHGGKKVKGANGQVTRDNSRTFLTGAQLSGNFTATIYANLPSNATYGRFRDVQLSAEFDKPFGGTLTDDSGQQTITSSRAVLSFAGYGQYQYDPTVLTISAGNLAPGTNIALPGDAQTLLGTAGWLGVLQGKLVINLSKGLQIPVALKWSNKTNLLPGNDVRGQFGISYDLSALSNLLAGKT